MEVFILKKQNKTKKNNKQTNKQKPRFVEKPMT